MQFGNFTVGDVTPDPVIVGLRGQVFLARTPRTVREFWPCFDNAPVCDHGPSFEDFTEQTPADRGLSPAGHRPDPVVPGDRRRLPDDVTVLERQLAGLRFD